MNDYFPQYNADPAPQHSGVRQLPNGTYYTQGLSGAMSVYEHPWTSQVTGKYFPNPLLGETPKRIFHTDKETGEVKRIA